MGIKRFAQDLIPPIFLQAVKSVRGSKIRTYKSYDEAIRDSSIDGYETDDVVKVVVAKNKKFVEKIKNEKIFDIGMLRTLIGIGVAKKERMRVLDFGGGGGYHYYIAKNAFDVDVELSWCVVETPAMAKMAKCELETTSLRFAPSIDEAVSILGEVDLIFSSGTLHTTDNPLKHLKELIDVSAKNIFITRTSFSQDDQEHVFIQNSLLSHNGPGELPEGFKDKNIFYPNVFVPISKSKELILSSGYSIRFEIIEERNVYKFGSSTFSMYGFYCEKIDQ